MALDLGFQPVEKPVQEVLDLFMMSEGGIRRLTWRNGFAKPGPEYTLYLVGLTERSGENTSHVGGDSLALLSPNLALPQFLALGMDDRWSQAGTRWKGLAESLLGKFLTGSSGLQRVEFPERPDFDERFLVFSNDETAIRSLFTNRLLDGILQSGVKSLRGRGNGLAVSLGGMGTQNRQRLTPGEIADLTGGAVRLYNLFGQDEKAAFENPPATVIPARMQPYSAPSYAGPVKCAVCGATNGAGSTICAYCGAGIGGGPAGGGTSQGAAAGEASGGSSAQIKYDASQGTPGGTELKEVWSSSVEKGGTGTEVGEAAGATIAQSGISLLEKAAAFAAVRRSRKTVSQGSLQGCGLGIVFILVGVFILLIFSTTSELRCNKGENDYIDCTLAESLMGVQIRSKEIHNFKKCAG